MKLSERLEARAAFEDNRVLDEAKAMGFVPDVYTGSQTGALLREAAELARRVEDAPCAVAGQSPGRFYYVGGSAPVEHGQRVRIVPEAGLGGGEG